MSEEQLRFAVNIIEHGGTYPGYKNGSGHKGVRFEQFAAFFKSAFGDEANALVTIQELIRTEKVIAVNLEWRETEYNRRAGRRSLGKVEVAAAIRKDENPMLYVSSNVPRPVRAKLGQVERRLKYVNETLARA